MLALTLLPIGGGIGFFLAKWMLSLAETANQQVLVGVVGTVIAGGALWPLLQMNLGLEMDAGFSGQKLAVFLVRGLAALLLSLFLVSSLSHLGARAGIWLLDKGIILGAIGNFIKVIGEFFLLALPSLMGLLGAFVAVALGSTYGQELVLRIAEGRARAITAVLTVTGTAIFVYAIGAGLNWLYQFDNPANWTTIPATVVGIVLGTGSLFVAPKRPFAIGNAIYAISRGILNTLRSIEPLIMAIIFVVWVGLGPFAGVMALTLHTIAALGKLFSEQIEGISEGPIEAITATGANQLQTITYAVIPQIIPPYIAYTLYRWDINVRMSTIIGFVGGGGIGFLLSQSIRLLQYEDASVMMLAIAFVVSALDYISSKARTRII
ncbi:MAG: phosphonate ABC transporter, permease protein PhnE [Chloroflexi bacterium]|nr:MAG: phosphonate ABC transporter, permease protein PhnE [Chloroflexota bacterium]